MARGSFWSEAESALLARLVQAGAGDAEIAAGMGRSRRTILRKRKLLGLAPGCAQSSRLAMIRHAALLQAMRDAAPPEEATMEQPRPTAYTPELGRELCRRLSDGSSLSLILRDPAMPARETVRRWRHEHPAFAADYWDASEDLVEALAEHALERAGDAASALDVAASRALTGAVKLYADMLAAKEDICLRRQLESL